jgi:aspartyl protease family protein
MTGDDTASLIYASIAAMLVASSLFARRLPIGQTLKMLLAWLAIFSAGFVLFSFREEAGVVWKRVKSELSPGGMTESNGSVTIRQNDDGHFWIDANINGVPARLMVDSGATVTALSVATAKAARVDVDESGFPMMINTANGAIEAKRARAATFRVGPIERKDFPVIVSENFGDTNVVGMNFLSTLDGWRVEGNELLLNPKP